MRAALLLAIVVIVASSGHCSHIQSVDASVDAGTEKKHEKFVPLVAFECGFRNKFMGEDGSWVTDVNRYATCQSGKLDILKYCRKAYPKLDITNIVEYSHEVKISSWCREEGTPCKWTHTVRPYQCIVGEFHSEALQVPHGCRFGHVSNRQSCDDYPHWKDEARKQCQSKVAEGKRMIVRSFAVLEPCGLDLFTGVEFVCCPSDEKSPESVEKAVDHDKKKEGDDADDRDDYEEDYSDEDDDEEKESDQKGNAQDPYFKLSDPANEHEHFKEAEQRLDKKHRAKIDKVMQEWADLELRYKKMKEIDAKGAEAFKLEMTKRFQKTVASLEEENKEQKRQLEDVHEERVQANLNEKKRQATHDYRAALAVQVGTANKHNVLKTLKTYIRAEEKDRTHMLNRYRHLLRTDQAEAETFKPILLHRLRYIDLRINGTLAMLRDFPELERQVRPIAIEFWSDYRRENTPEVTDDEYTAIGGDAQNTKLVAMYKESYDRVHNPSALKKVTTTAATTTTTVKAEAAEDSDEDDDDDDDDDDSIEEGKKDESKAEKIAIEKIVKEKKPGKPAESSDEDDSEEEDEEGVDNEKSVERELHVEIEPIVSEPVRVHDLPPRPAYAKHETLVQHKMEAEHVGPASQASVSTHVMLVFAASATIVFTIFAIVIARHRSRHAGFIEVDVCTPEERHVNGMQVNGYENPTYSFFDNKP